MSFSEICDKFDPVVYHMKRGEKVIGSVINIFKSYRRCIEIANNQFDKAIEVFKTEVPREGGLDTMSTALNSLIEYCQKQVKSQHEFSSNISNELTRPLESFLTQYLTTINQNVSKGLQLIKENQKFREKTIKAKEKYYSSSEQLEKCEKLEKSEENKEKLEKLIKNSNNQKVVAAKNLEFYDFAYKELSQAYNRHDSEMPSIMDTLQKTDESYIHFMKLTLDKFTKSHGRFLSLSKDSIDEFSIVLSNINSNIDIRVFVDTIKTKSPSAREEFVIYERLTDSKIIPKPPEEKVKEDDYEIFDPTGGKPGEDPDSELAEKVLDHLIPEDLSCSSPANLDPYFYSKISELLHTPDGRGTFCDILESKKHRCHLVYSKAIQLTGLIKSFLTSMMAQNDNDSAVFCKIVFLAHVFYTEDDHSKRRYLTHFLENHSIWQDKERWIDAVVYSTNLKTQVEADGPRLQSRKKKGLLSMLKNFGKSAVKPDQDTQREIKLAAFSTMEQFCFHMIHLGLAEEVTNEIVLRFCNKYELDEDRKTSLLVELQANQKITTQLVPGKLSLQLRLKESKRWDRLLPVGLAVDFLHPLDCVELLLVSKLWNEQLKLPVYKKWLLDWNLHEVKKHRLRNWVWLDVLKASSRPIDYHDLLGKILADTKQIEGLAEIIDIDVARSYQGNDLMPPQILKNLLKTYAFYNEELGYCQGMNYVVGTVFLQLQDEDLTFKALVSLIDKFQMKELFISSLPKLKLFFYTLDRIVAITLPELHEKFKEVSICSGHFSSPWFITLYSSVLQGRPELLYPIWDMFILEGWKTIFKVAVLILSRLSRLIVAGRFEDIMFLLTNLSASPELFDSDFLGRVRRVNISNALLRNLESEYEHLKLKASSFSKNIYF